MNKIIFDKNNTVLFDPILEFEFEGDYIDLHNDFVIINYSLNEERNCIFYLLSEEDKPLKLTFTSCKTVRDNYKIKDGVIDNLSRCRILENSNLFDELDNKICFLIQILPNTDIEITCESLIISR